MSDNIPLNKENLIERLDRLLEWIKSCDIKSSIVIASSGIFLTIFTSEHSIKMLNQIVTEITSNLNFSNFLYTLLLLCSSSYFIYGTYCLIRVLVPMLKKEIQIFKDTRSDSLYYFESIGEKNYLEFKEKMLNESLDNELEDLLTQIYINAKICTVKYYYYQKGIKYSFIGISGILILYIVGIILLKVGGLD